MKKALIPLVASLAMLVVPGCILVPPGSTGSGISLGTTGGSGTIVVAGLAANPTNIADANSRITFTVVAQDNNGLPMQYTWSATKGTLSATAGQMVYWSPDNSAGQVDSGTATVMVLITDSSGASQEAAVNLTIQPSGQTVVSAPTATPAPTSSPTPAPTASPSASPSPSPSASPSASPVV